MKIVSCPNCNSKDIEFKCHHNNRRKKVPIDVFFCKQCKKRFTVEDDKKFYNHSGNARKKNKICYYCRNHFDNDTEKLMGVCFDCVVRNYDEYGHYVGTFEDWLFYIMDYEEYEKISSLQGVNQLDGTV